MIYCEINNVASTFAYSCPFLQETSCIWSCAPSNLPFGSSCCSRIPDSQHSTAQGSLWQRTWHHMCNMTQKSIPSVLFSIALRWHLCTPIDVTSNYFTASFCIIFTLPSSYALHASFKYMFLFCKLQFFVKSTKCFQNIVIFSIIKYKLSIISNIAIPHNVMSMCIYILKVNL